MTNLRQIAGDWFLLFVQIHDFERLQSGFSLQKIALF